MSGEKNSIKLLKKIKMNKIKMFSIGLFAGTTIFLSSCATLLSGTKDRIVINSTPPGADVYIDGKQMGKSGQDIILKRKFTNTRQVNLRKEGYEDLYFGIDPFDKACTRFDLFHLGIVLNRNQYTLFYRD